MKNRKAGACLRKVAERGSGSTKAGRFIQGLRMERTGKMSKYVEDIQRHVSHCQKKKLQTCKGKKEKIE